MKKLAIAALFSFALLQPAFAADVPVSDASVHELLEVMHAKKMMIDMQSQVAGMMRDSMKQALAGQTVTAEQQKIMDETSAELAVLFRQEMRWEEFEPVMIAVYKKSFTQQEMDGMLAFYKSDVGQSIVAKMPLVVQNSMQTMQAHMNAIMPKLQKIVAEAVEKMLTQNANG